MAHSDDEGLILPPRIAFQVVIVPIYKGDEKKRSAEWQREGNGRRPKVAGISVKFDDNEESPRMGNCGT